MSNADLHVLNADLPNHGLRRGDLGTVVEVYAGLEVEFVTASGRTTALVSLAGSDVQRSGTTIWLPYDR